MELDMDLYLSYQGSDQGSDPPTIDHVGGKGLSLIKSTQKRHSVPPAMILSTEFFTQWMKKLKSSSEWKSFSLAKQDEIGGAASAVKKSCQSLVFTEKQKQILAEVRKHLQVKGISLMAVRSSSPEEDLEGSSFAGIYETILGVTEDGLEEAIKICFASALDERVIIYKQKSGFDPYDPKIAVIIQKQVASEVSGVAFSLNPMNNCFDQCMINANFGLGVTVVDGTITPDQWVVEKVKGIILEKTLGKKDVAVYLKSDGGTESKAPQSHTDLCLNEEQVLAVTALNAQVEADYGKPMDIEWAYEDGQLYLLQARPITTYYRLPEEMITKPGGQKNLYHDAILTEQGLSESLSPLGCDLFILFAKYLLPGKPNDDFQTINRGLAFVSGGRMYTQFGRMLKIMGKNYALNTYRIIDALGTQILGTMNLKEYIPKKFPKGFLKNFMITGVGALQYIKPMMRASRKPDEYLQHYIEENAKLKKDLKAAYERDSSFEDFCITSFSTVGSHMNGIQLPALMVSEKARSKLKKMFKNDPESVQEHLKSIEKAFSNNVTIEMGLTLYKLSQFSDIRQNNTAQEFIQKLDANQLSLEFMQKWQLFLEDYGFRSPKEIDVATSRYIEMPEEVFTLLKTMSSLENSDFTPLGSFEQGAKHRVESVKFLEEYLAKKRPGKAKAFKKRYKQLKNFTAYRESPKYYMIMALNYARRRALALGKKWVEAGRLDSVDQVFALKWDEFVQAEVDSSLDIRVLAKINHDYFAQFNPNSDPPIVIDSRGFIPKLPLQPREENEFVGTPISSGTVRGPVKVLKTPNKKPILPGDILVTKATDPGWTTLFINAGGILLETGGTLQHGASIAREMGKPCVVGIENVTKILKDGQIVEFDGAVGIIKIIQ
ncbi:MAG: PEP/pyruvate-binding domain-containing protein [Promethearchaeota archaeon]